MSGERPAVEARATGVQRIAQAFAAARQDGRTAALMPYLMAGCPDLAGSRQIARAYVEGGADLIELGIPFSDPLADGPVIHAAAVQALRAGANLHDALQVARSIADQVPVVAMCYANPILARGLERFADMLVDVGACGLIVPDLPFEEAQSALAACDERGLALIALVAPTTPAQRLERIGAGTRGFLYTVAVTGITGERAAGDGALPDLLARVRAQTTVPVAVGFGIGTPE
ncbi:MAG: tryptophan synthase subunit alpha, partial [Solirubrobacteraceae bacterium]